MRQFYCPKCGYNDVIVKYNYNRADDKEYLACKCRRCEYCWSKDVGVRDLEDIGIKKGEI